jgi:cytochrome P450
MPTVRLDDQADPYADYARWYDDARLPRCDFLGGAWLVHRFADVRRVLASPNDFSSVDRTVPGVASTMVAADPPEHGRLRGAVAPAFGARAVAALEPVVGERASGLIEPLRDGAEIEFVADVAAPMAADVVAELLGVRPEDRPSFADAANALIGRADGIAERLLRIRALHECLAELVAVGSGPTADAVRTGALTVAEAVDTSMVLVVAGVETSARLLANLVLTLANHPEERSSLIAEPARRSAAIEEVLRYEPPIHAVPRLAARDVAIGGTEIAAGERVLVVLAAANRDPSAFTSPNQFRVGRSGPVHLGFGAGPHRCLGAALARMTGWIVVDELLRAVPSLELTTAESELAWAPGFPLLRSPEALWVVAR